MKLQYQLSNTDFLEYELYTSSKSELHRKKRNRSRIHVPIVYGIIGLATYFNTKEAAALIIWFGIAIIWFSFYPLYSKWNYKKHLKKYVGENYKNRVDKLIKLEFDSDFLETSDFTSQSRINYSELKEFIELPNIFFIKLTSDMSIIIPKHGLDSSVAFKSKMLELKIHYVDECFWKWN